MNKKILLSVGLATGLVFTGGTLLNMNNVEPVKASNIEKTISKEEIRYKMLNAIDNYQTAKTKATVFLGGQGLQIDIDATVDVTNGRSNVKYTDTYHSTGQVVKSESVSDLSENKILSLYDTNRAYKQSKLAEFYTDTNTMKEEFLEEFPTSESRTADNVTVIRPDPTNMELAGKVLFPQDYALVYLKDSNLWKIDGEEKMLDRDVVRISGTFDEAVQQQGHKTFKIWVDKETGVVTKYESYTPEGKLFNYTHVESLTLNGPMERSTFNFDIPTNYKDISQYPVY